MKINILILFSFFTLVVSQPGLSQKANPSQKGAIPLPQGGTTNNTSASSVHRQHLSTNKTTRAVIVGISDYQSPEIPDLKYADKDAIAFAEWLQSPAGGNVKSTNIQLLTNQNATQSKFSGALDWLLASSHENDQAIIYFSGHGDIEVSLHSQPGYLLCWDAPPKVYTAGGTFRLSDLQDIISTISIDKKAQVLIITDACHSGKLAGSSIGGSQATAMALKHQFANETKILSCQPNEYSLEGTQWGGGRGVFSYYLLEGLTGLADKDQDQSVTLFEIDQYLDEKVVAETKPQTQTPITVGDRQSIVSYVNTDELKALIKSKNYNNEEIQTIGFKGTVETYLKTADTLIKRIYNNFEFALDKGELLESNKQSLSANELFDQLFQLEPGNPLVDVMRRNLAAALQDEVQQALNAVLDDNPYEINNWRFNKNKYIKYPNFIDHAIKLLGTKHYSYKPLMAKKLFWEAFNLVHYSATFDEFYSDSLKLAARKKLYEALRFDETAFIYYALANTYLYTNTNDSIDIYYKKAMTLAPKWKLPYSEICWHYMVVYPQITKADKWLKEGLAIDPDAYNLLEMNSWLYQRYDMIDSVEAICARMRKLHPDLPNDYVTLSISYAHVKRNFTLAEIYDYKAKQLGTLGVGLNSYIYLNTRRLEEAKRIDYPSDPTYGSANIYSGLIMFHHEKQDTLERMDSIAKGKTGLLTYRGIINIVMHKYDTAELLFRNALSNYDSGYYGHIVELSYLGLICSRTGRIKEAEDFFKKASNDHPELNQFQQKLTYSLGSFLYGNFLAEQNRFQEAEEKYQYINEKDYGCVFGLYGMATLSARQGKDKEALDWLEKALDWYFPRPEPIYDEPVFKNIRKTKRFKEMMEKNFPEELRIKN